ncbi:MAG TPA: VIT1/CCC1 transporter family protein [Hyphomicrobiaceae bacterium]|nr:VIT1/CCC1 transporter family protein [Hyphomicrobiaceae bacterium]
MLAEIYVKRGVDQSLARQVAQQLMAKDALTAHARDELGISEFTTARPVQAALTSAATFSVGAALPLLMVVVSPAGALVAIVSAASLGFLALLGAIGATAGGANILRATARVTFWGAFAMALPVSGNYSERLFELMALAGRLVNDVLCALVRQGDNYPPPVPWSKAARARWCWLAT